MPYWFLDKENEEPSIFGSLKEIAETTDLTTSQLYDVFSRKKKLVFQNDKYWIVKTNIKRVKQNEQTAIPE